MNPRRFVRRVRSARWPRRFAYPITGGLISFGLFDGLLLLQGWASRQEPTAQWIRAQVGRQPLVYLYLLVATLLVMVVLGWLLGRKEDELVALSVTDPLTGLTNRRRLRSEFDEELNRAARYGTPLALLLIDLDHLKAVNDQNGHAAGDRALLLVAESLRRSCRATDVAARHGGDEFMVLAVNTSASEALALAHRICATVRRLSATNRSPGVPKLPRLTVSVGAADLDRAAAPSFDALHAAADQALYQAKADGRDRAVIAPPFVGTGRQLRGGRGSRRDITSTKSSGTHGLPT